MFMSFSNAAVSGGHMEALGTEGGREGRLDGWREGGRGGWMEGGREGRMNELL